MNRKWLRTGTALAWMASLLLWGGAGRAGVIVNDEFRGAPKGVAVNGTMVDVGAGKKGWKGLGGESATVQSHLEYDLAGKVRADKGTIEVTVVRDELRDPEAVFGLADEGGNRLFVVEVYWGGLWLETGKPEVNVSVMGGTSGNVWYSIYEPRGGKVDNVAFPRAVPKGGTARVAMTWGGPEGYAVYVDGERVAAKYDEPFALGEILPLAKKLVVGAEFTKEGAFCMTRSAVTGVRVFDRALVAGELMADAAAESIAAEKQAYGGGQEIVVTVRGTKDREARFGIEGVASGVAMQEVDDGVYVGKVKAPIGVDLAAARITAILRNPAGGGEITEAGPTLRVDGTAPEAVAAVVSPLYEGGIDVSWGASTAGDLDHYAVYRGDGKAPAVVGAGIAVKGLKYTDTRVLPGIRYQYTVVPVDAAGNFGEPSPVVAAVAPVGDGPRIAGVTVEPAGKAARPGAALTVTVAGQSGGEVAVDLEGLVAGLALQEAGRSGKYSGTYTVQDTDVQATKVLHRVVVHLKDAYGASDLGGPEVAVVGLDGLNDHTPPVIAKVGHDGSKAAGISGKLVAGDVVTVTAEGEAAGYASAEIPGAVAAVAMKETQPGVYEGSLTVPWGAYGSFPVVVRLADDGGNEATATAERALDVDARVRLSVKAEKALIPADKKTQTKLVARAENANGKGIESHEIALTLSTTEEYTGVVGGGAVEGKLASKDDEDDVEVKWGGKTDGFGEVKATYTAGFAAKTALLVAKDLTTGDVGAGWLNTYVASTVAIELTPRARKGMEDRAVLRLSADPGRLTADGRSTARLRASLVDLTGKPIAGASVAFALAGENGRLRVLKGTTDAKGLAEAEYRAGTAMGVVTVTASAAEYGVTSAVEIWLLADAPAKIDLVASATKLVADGHSEATVSVKVTDINDNPNENVPVLFTLLSGSGKFSAGTLNTDTFGRGKVTFTAGTTAGMAVLEARHTSRAPTDVELRRVYGTVFVPRLYDRQERDRLTVTEWLVKGGDTVEKGQVLATVDTKTGAATLKAPAKGVFVRQVKHDGDRVELGDTIGYVEIDPTVWTAEYGK